MDGVGVFKYNSDISGYDVKHVLCVRYVQVFFLWWHLNIDLPFGQENNAIEQYKKYEEIKNYKNEISSYN